MFRTGGRVGLARRDLMADWRRLVVGVLAIGLAMMLILLLGGLWQGVKTQASIYPDHARAQLFVTQRGVANFAGETSRLPASTVGIVRHAAGVDWAAAVRGQFVVFDLHAQKVAAYVVGYVPNGRGGPWRLAKGRAIRSDGEVVVDRSLADRHGLGIGELLSVGGQRFRIVGLSSGTSATMTGFVFISHAAADRLLQAPGTTSYVLVGTKTPGATTERLRTLGLTVFTRQQLAANDRSLAIGIFGAPIKLMVGVAAIAGTLIVALTVYAAVTDRRREYGVIKAIGASRLFIVGVVVRQAIVLSLAGLAVGGVMFWLARNLLHAWRPQFLIVLTSTAVFSALIGAIVMAMLAAILPARQVANAEPASVYRGA